MSEDLSPLKKKLVALSQPKQRGRLYFFILLAACIAIFFFGFLEQSQFEAEDKQKHFVGGQLISTLVLTIGYLLLAVFMLLRPAKVLITRLFWLPALFCLIAGLGMGAVILAGFGKEALDSTGMGHVEWADVTATLEGGYAPNFAAILIMLGICPALIPLDILLQIPQKWTLENVSTNEIDDYLSVSNKQKKRNNEVLLLEDDIASATLVMKFFKKLKLSCAHVETLSAAESAFHDIDQEFKVIVIDCFVRIESAEDRRTGADWLEELHQAFPKEKRKFYLIIITGHPEQLGHRASMADLVLKKPWEPSTLLDYLRSVSIVS